MGRSRRGSLLANWNKGIYSNLLLMHVLQYSGLFSGVPITGHWQAGQIQESRLSWGIDRLIKYIGFEENPPFMWQYPFLYILLEHGQFSMNKLFSSNVIFPMKLKTLFFPCNCWRQERQFDKKHRNPSYFPFNLTTVYTREWTKYKII